MRRGTSGHGAFANCGHNGVLTPTQTRKAGSTMGNAGRGFGVLGPLQLNAGGTPVTLGAPKQRAVLAMLVINRNRPVSVESLIDAARSANLTRSTRICD